MRILNKNLFSYVTTNNYFFLKIKKILTIQIILPFFYLISFLFTIIFIYYMNYNSNLKLDDNDLYFIIEEM